MINLKLQVSNGYKLDFRQVSRLLSIVARIKEVDGSKLEALSDSLGWARVQVKNLASLTVACGLIRRGSYALEAFGELILHNDPFFDDIGTLWLCHYHLGSNPRWVVWNRLVNGLLPETKTVTFDTGKEYLSDLADYYSPRSLAIHIGKEVRTFLDAYTEQALSRLAYLTREQEEYSLGQSSPPHRLIFLTQLLVYRDRFFPGNTAMEISRLLSAPNSPGKVCNISEAMVRNIVESLHQNGELIIESRGDLDQVRFYEHVSATDAFSMYYDLGRS